MKGYVTLYHHGKRQKDLIFLITLIFLMFSTKIFAYFLSNEMAQLLTFLILVLNGSNLIEASYKGNTFNRSLAIVTLILSILYYQFPTQRLIGFLSFIFLFLYLLFITYFLFSMLLKVKIVGQSQIIAAFSGYILIGLIGSFLFKIILLFHPDAISIAIPQSDPQGNLVYFSFISMITIGYGDIVPVSFWAQRLAMLLGLVGQFYLSIIVAIFIGKFLKNS
jgi:hypothetical protein